MNDTEIGALRQKLASRVRSDDYRQRRKDMDARALEYKLAPDVTVEPVTANGVRAEWTSTPNDGKRSASGPVQAAARVASSGCQFHGRSSAMRRAGWSAMRASTSAR